MARRHSRVCVPHAQKSPPPLVAPAHLCLCLPAQLLLEGCHLLLVILPVGHQLGGPGVAFCLQGHQAQGGR